MFVLPTFTPFAVLNYVGGCKQLKDGWEQETVRIAVANKDGITTSPKSLPSHYKGVDIFNMLC